MTSYRINNLQDPSSSADAATKSYVDTKTTDMATNANVATATTGMATTSTVSTAITNALNNGSMVNNPTVADSGDANANYRLLYTASTSGRATLYNDGQLYYNPSTDTLNSTYFSGQLKGSIHTAPNAATGFFTQGNATIPSRWDIYIYNGMVGIGSSGAAAPLHVFGSATNTVTGTGRFWSSGGGTGTSAGNSYYISIISEHSIWSKGYEIWITSDQRIKKNIVNLNADKMMNVFRNLRPISFDFIDTMKNNNKKHFGFIAQEIKEILPEGISLNTDVIPNNMMKGGITKPSETDEEPHITLKPTDTDISLNYLSLSTDSPLKFDTANPYSSTDTYKFKVHCGEKWTKEQDIYIRSDYNVIDDKYTYVIGMKKEVYDIVITEPTLFVYGQYVYDLHILDHDTIYTVATAALQEVDRQQQADKVRIAELETKVSIFESKMVEQQSLINDILERLKTLEKA